LAADISTKGLLIKDNADTAKRQIVIRSKDPSILGSDAVDPGTNGAILYAYSNTDDDCAILPGGPNWTNRGTKWTFRDKATKNSAQIKDGALLMRIKSNVNYSLSDNGTQGTVNIKVQFGSGTRFCMRCTGNKRDDITKFQARDCVAAACDTEPSICPPPSHVGVVLKGALPPTYGRFNYNLTLGLPGANAACNTNFPGTQACTYAQLQAAQGASDLSGLRDIANNAVKAFWAIDPMAAPLLQCNDDAMGGSGLNWEYAT